MIVENHILTLIKVISALYFENIASDSGAHVVEEVQQIMGNIKLSNNNQGLGSEEAAVEALRYTADWMLGECESGDVKFSRDNILQRMTVNLHCENEYIETAKQYLDDKITPADARNRITEIMSELRFDKKQNKFKTIIAKANTQVNFNTDFLDTGTYVKTLLGELEDLNASNDGESPGFIGRINFDKPKEIEAVLKRTTESYSTEGILNTGMQGLNKSTGVGGFRRGEFVNFGATTHNYKSGALIDLALFIPMYNDPWMVDPDKKPLILRISFENTMEQDIGIMYKKLHEIKYQEKCDIADINTLKAAKYLAKHFGQRGYHFQLETFDPNSFCIYDLFDVINKYLEMGYEIHAISCDYLSLFAHNTIGDRTDSKISKTYEMARNFCNPKGITFITAHQLSTEALTLQRDNTTSFTKKVSTGGWYENCKSLHTKLDLEYITGIHNHQDGNRYLFYSRGKHRGGESTPLTHCHFIRKFEEFGGIVPDVDNEDLTLYKLPGIIDVDQLPMWD